VPARAFHWAVWTGSEMIVWGGATTSGGSNTGARFQYGTGTWLPISTTGAPDMTYGTPEAVLWAGTRLIVTGGYYNQSVERPPGFFGFERHYRPNSYLYDPVADAWSTIGSLSYAQGFSAVWTGTEAIFWGGAYCSEYFTYPGPNYWHFYCDSYGGGTRFNPATGTTSSVSNTGAPQERYRHTAVSVGSHQMLVWGGSVAVNQPPSYYEYQPAADGWYVPNYDIDADEDGQTQCSGDCDDTRASVYAGAPQICDGINNDCSDPAWPQVPAAELDADGDGYTTCGGDCDDADPATNSAAPEINDGKDNECPGSPGAGAIDELSGDLSWVGSASTPDFCWLPQSGAVLYEVARSGVASFAGGCQIESTNATCWNEPETPSPGQVFFYLVRPQTPHTGSWGQDSTGAVRSNVCPGIATAYTFTFADTAADDIAATRLNDFFTMVPGTPTSFLSFEVDGSPTGGALCTERADFYRDLYLGYAGTTFGAFTSSGSWNKWYRDGTGPWSGPTTASFTNYVGAYCSEKWAWCPDYEMGSLMLYVRPGGPSSCEIAQDFPAVCGAGAWRLKVRISEDRFVACGF
jgi:hypothetical protein